MTIAEAGSVGRIKHNFSVMVRGVGFSTLIISSTSQSRPPSRPPPASLSPRSRISLYLSVPRYRYTTLAPGNTFPCIFLGHSPRSRSPFTLRSHFPLQPCDPVLPPSVLHPTQQLSSSPPILSLSISLFRAFSPLLCRALITNFSLLS